MVDQKFKACLLLLLRNYRIRPINRKYGNNFAGYTNFRNNLTFLTRRLLSYHHNPSNACNFGLLFDIDGVILRGRTILPDALEALRLLTDSKGNFRVPSVFVTNSSSTLRSTKAQQLTEKLRVKIMPEQVILAHSPLRAFRKFHNKHVLVCGQGPVRAIAKQIGFTKISTVDDLRHAFPNLDCFAVGRKIFTPCSFEKFFPRIEAVILLGDPMRWETCLQLICDTLMTGGRPSQLFPDGSVQHPHIPLLACNTDLLWMAEARIPRFAHGAFLLCLETLYKKLTSHELKYTALIGKPSKVTYYHAEYCLRYHAACINLPPPATIYAIGDNPESDVLGANLFEQFLWQRALHHKKPPCTVTSIAGKAAGGSGGSPVRFVEETALNNSGTNRSSTFNRNNDENVNNNGILSNDEDSFDFYNGFPLAEHCYSVLVETGVYSPCSEPLLAHLLQWEKESHSGVCHATDLNYNPVLKTPAFVEKNIYTAVRMIFEREYFR